MRGGNDLRPSEASARPPNGLTSYCGRWPLFIGLLRVVEDDAERVARPPRDRAHAVTHGRAMPAPGAADGPVARGEDHQLPPLGVDRLAPRLRPGPLLDEQEITALVVDATAAQKRGDLQREGDVAVEVLVQAVVAAGLVVEQQRRRLRLSVPAAEAEQ